MSLSPALVTKEQANAFVKRFHRHHDPDQGARFYVGAWDLQREELCGVAVVGRPRASAIDQVAVGEVTRLATDETRNACSFLYANAGEIARLRGFRAIITYTLKRESGASLRALGWWPEEVVMKDRDWSNRPGRKFPGTG